MTKIWRVCGTLTDCYEGENRILFEAHFTTIDAAREVYNKGERAYGESAGFPDMKWVLEGFTVDNNLEPMFEDVKNTLEMFFPEEN